MNSSFTLDTGALLSIFLVLFTSAFVLAITLSVLVIVRIRRITLPPHADFFTALRATPLVVVIVLDLLDLTLDIFSAPIAWAMLGYLGLAPLRGVAVVKDLIPVTNFVPLMSLAWLYARYVDQRLFPSGVTLPRIRK